MSHAIRRDYSTGWNHEDAEPLLQPESGAFELGYKVKCPECKCVWAKPWHIESDVCKSCQRH